MTSPGRATAARALTEAALERSAVRSYRRFLREASSGVVWQAWEEHADRMVDLFARRFPTLDKWGLRSSVLNSGLPDDVHAELENGTKLLPRSQMAWGQEQMLRWLRTETTAVSNSTSLVQLAADGHSSKRWISHHDAATRPTHSEADGQTVPISATFTVGGSALLYPGDPMAPPSERENCRCVLVGVA